MNFETIKNKEDKSHSAVNTVSKRKSGRSQGFEFVDNRSQTIIQQKLQDAIQNTQTVQKKVNRTGLPDQLKSGIEGLSGYAMDDVKVYYNSDKPAQLNAHAYAQGSDIHVASGQEKHLPHEAWHVVQQKQGRVQPTMQLKGKVSINDDVALENEADIMGQKALQQKITATGDNYEQREETLTKAQSLDDSQTVNANHNGPIVVQRAMGMEIELGRGVGSKTDQKLEGDAHIIEAPIFNLVTDSRGPISNIEFVMKHFNQHEGDDKKAESELTLRLNTMKVLYDLINKNPGGHKTLKSVASGYTYATTPIPTKVDSEETTAPDEVRLLPAKEGDASLYVQYTIGLDLTKMNEGIDFIERHSYNHKKNSQTAKEHARDALDFSEKLTEGGILNDIEDKQAVRGYLTLLYMQVAAFADAIQGKIDKTSKDKFPTEEAIERSPGQIKNKTILLSRVPLQTIFKALSDKAQTVLDAEESKIIDLMAEIMERQGMSFAENATRDMAGLKQVKLIEYVQSGLKKGVEVIEQQQVFGGMKEVDMDDSVPGKRAVPLELRSFNKTFISWGDLEKDAKILLDYSRGLHK